MNVLEMQAYVKKSSSASIPEVLTGVMVRVHILAKQFCQRYFKNNQ